MQVRLVDYLERTPTLFHRPLFRLASNVRRYVDCHQVLKNNWGGDKSNAIWWKKNFIIITFIFPLFSLSVYPSVCFFISLYSYSPKLSIFFSNGCPFLFPIFLSFNMFPIKLYLSLFLYFHYFSTFVCFFSLFRWYLFFNSSACIWYIQIVMYYDIFLFLLALSVLYKYWFFFVCPSVCFFVPLPDAQLM